MCGVARLEPHVLALLKRGVLSAYAAETAGAGCAWLTGGGDAGGGGGRATGAALEAALLQAVRCVHTMAHAAAGAALAIAAAASYERCTVTVKHLHLSLPMTGTASLRASSSRPARCPSAASCCPAPSTARCTWCSPAARTQRRRASAAARRRPRAACLCRRRQARAACGWGCCCWVRCLRRMPRRVMRCCAPARCDGVGFGVEPLVFSLLIASLHAAAVVTRVLRRCLCSPPFDLHRAAAGRRQAGGVPAAGAAALAALRLAAGAARRPPAAAEGLPRPLCGAAP